MVAEDDPFVGGLEIVAVAQALGGRGALVVQRHHPRGKKSRIKAIAQQIGTNSGEHQPDAVDWFSAGLGDRGHRKSGGNRNQDPQETHEETEHSTKNTETAHDLGEALRCLAEEGLSKNHDSF